MTNEQARKIFDQVIQNCADKERIAKIEMIREYFTNEDFRNFMQDEIWAINNR